MVLISWVLLTFLVMRLILLEFDYFHMLKVVIFLSDFIKKEIATWR